MMNLLPPEIKTERLFGRRNRSVIGYSVAALSVGFACFAIILFNLQFLNAQENRLQTEISKNKDELAGLQESQNMIDKTAKQLKTIEQLFAGEVKFSEVIPSLASILPSGVVLDSLSLTGGSLDPLQLSFRTKTQQLGAVLQQNLANSELFEAAEIVSISGSGSGTAGDSSYPYNVSITVSFKGAAEAKKKKAAAEKAAAEEAAKKEEEAAKSGGGTN